VNAVCAAKSAMLLNYKELENKNRNLTAHSWQLNLQYNQHTYVVAVSMYSQVIKDVKNNF
jgi:hypothetical protein